MSALQIAAYVADAVILGSYARAAHVGRYRAYNVVNVVTGPILVALSIVAGAPALGVLPAAFAVLGAWALYRDARSKEEH